MSNLNNVKLLASAFSAGLSTPRVDPHLAEMEEALQAAIEYIERDCDMVSTPDGDEPNEALRLVSWFQNILDR
jgi:hypothetical protein